MSRHESDLVLGRQEELSIKELADIPQALLGLQLCCLEQGEQTADANERATHFENAARFKEAIVEIDRLLHA